MPLSSFDVCIVWHHNALSGITRHCLASQGIVWHHKALSGIKRHCLASQGILPFMYLSLLMIEKKTSSKNSFRACHSLMVQQLLKKMEDVHKMCEKRMESLRQIVDPRSQANALHEQIEEGSKANKDFTDGSQRKKSEDDKKPTNLLEKSVRYRPDNHHQPSQQKSRSASSPTISRPFESASDFTASIPQQNHRSTSIGSSVITENHQSSLPLSSASLTEAEALLAMRKRVMNELTETEIAYVNELQQIIEEYYKKMDDRSMQMMIPPALLGKKHVLFGNLEDIYHFHKDVFLQELKDCRDCPSRVGKCFVNRKEEFQMYSIYCQNKPKSEALRMTVDDNNAFFKECQKSLGHKLPLGAYLLKPIQRITKYQLLLKEMLKFTSDNPEMTVALQEALDTMLSVLTFLNDSMHQVSITGYTENLSNLGLLLMHGSFRVWTEHKHERIRDLRLRPMQRHLFLYQRALLLCKKKDEQHGSNEHPCYTFKNKLNLSQVGLTEKIKSDQRKFELWLRGREEVYIIQAPDLQTKDVWVTEIKKVLKSQFDHIKGNPFLINPGHCRNSTISPGSKLTRLKLLFCCCHYSLDSWKTNDADRHSTVPSGMEMCSPLITPTSPPYQNTRGNLEEDREENEDNDGGWSSGEFSNSDEESYVQNIPTIEPSYKEHFVSLGDYFVVDPTELGLSEGDEVEVMRVGTNGWWYARHLRTDQEGWVPSTFLEPVSRAPSLYSSSDSLCVAGARSEMTRTSSSSYFRTNSPVPETTV
ncbi:unnamed protein product [Candidula unifasciata]|uniref:Guanine nucleotide exchange factor DBS n=1 Tax=Candidula unifasciata TaxID=100452 RepID=A0A8S4A094_9EUPU|nr:unnamed protein product [Candidula unifasciata]